MFRNLVVKQATGRIGLVGLPVYAFNSSGKRDFFNRLNQQASYALPTHRCLQGLRGGFE
jgi:hypothetical protein